MIDLGPNYRARAMLRLMVDEKALNWVPFSNREYLTTTAFRSVCQHGTYSTGSH